MINPTKFSPNVRNQIVVFLLLVLSLGADSAWSQSSTIDPKNSDPIIDSIEIIAENVFDLSQSEYDNFLFRLANATHFVTRHTVIRRELLVRQGDRFDTSLVQESLRNLRKLPYFLKSEIEFVQGESGQNILKVTTSDKWTTAGGVSYHRSGGRSDIQIGIEEKNLFGYGMFMSHDYFVLDHDRNFYQGQVGDRRFLGRNFSLNLTFSDNPRAGRKSIIFSRPFYSLSQKHAFETNFTKHRTRIDYYDESKLGQEAVLVAQDQTSDTKLYLLNQYRVGGDKVKYYFTSTYSYLELKAKERVFLIDNTLIDTTLLPQVPSDSLYHALNLSLRVRQINFSRYRRLNRFFKTEDYNLGFDGSVSIGWGRSHKLRETVYTYFSVRPQYLIGSDSRLFIFQYIFEQWNRSEDILRHRTIIKFKGYQRLNRYNTFVIGAQFLSDRLIDPSGILYLDEDHGLRGYPAYSFNGEERLVINIENRIFSDIEIMTIGLGGAIFADLGNIWSRYQDPRLTNTSVSFGAGFRFGISRSSQAEVIRFDLAYAYQLKSWQISIGTGQYF